jgi:peptidoglycan hydrolase-like protein with peptidoglycan-binding domain
MANWTSSNGRTYSSGGAPVSSGSSGGGSSRSSNSGGSSSSLPKYDSKGGFTSGGKYYAPNSIQATNSRNISSSGGSSSSSNSNSEVKALQQRLNAAGANLKVDGIFGPLTQSAVNKFGSTAAQATGSAALFNPATDPATQRAFAEQNRAERQASDNYYSEQTRGYLDSARQEGLISEADWQSYLAGQADYFKQQKTALDLNARRSGILFSSAREQQDTNLLNQVNRDTQANAANKNAALARMGLNTKKTVGSDAFAQSGINLGVSGGNFGYNPDGTTNTGTKAGTTNPYMASGSYFGSEKYKQNDTNNYIDNQKRLYGY